MPQPAAQMTVAPLPPADYVFSVGLLSVRFILSQIEYSMPTRSGLRKMEPLTAARPGRRENAIAIGAALVSAITLGAIAPIAQVPLARVDAFIPAYEAALAIIDLITAVLLFGQFERTRTLALLVLACGYLFDFLIIIPHALTFPGVFAAKGPSRCGSPEYGLALLFLARRICPIRRFLRRSGKLIPDSIFRNPASSHSHCYGYYWHARLGGWADGSRHCRAPAFNADFERRGLFNVGDQRG